MQAKGCRVDVELMDPKKTKVYRKKEIRSLSQVARFPDA